MLLAHINASGLQFNIDKVVLRYSLELLGIARKLFLGLWKFVTLSLKLWCPHGLLTYGTFLPQISQSHIFFFLQYPWIAQANAICLMSPDFTETADKFSHNIFLVNTRKHELMLRHLERFWCPYSQKPYLVNSSVKVEYTVLVKSSASVVSPVLVSI